MADIILALASISIGLLPRILLSIRGSSDETAALWLIRQQVGHRWINTTIDDSIINGFYGYPALYHFFLSRFPNKYWIRLGYIFNIGSDYIIAIFVFSISMFLGERIGLQNSATYTISIMATTTYLTYPVLLLPKMARMRGLSARAIGGPFVIGYGCSIGFAILYEPGIGTMSAIAFALACILISQFALQAVLFFSILLALLQLSWLPVLAISFALLIASVIRPLKAKDILLQYINHKIWYAKNYQNGTSAWARNRLQDFRRFPEALITRNKLLKRLILRDLTPVIFIYSAPALILLGILVLSEGPQVSRVLSDPVGRLLLDWTLASFVTFVLVSFRPLSFVGEAERYFEYSAPTVSVLVAVTVACYSTSIGIAVPAILIAIHITIFFWLLNYTGLKATRRENPDEVLAVSRMLAEQDDELRVAAIPYKLATKLSDDICALNRKGKFFYNIISVPGKLNFPYMHREGGGPRVTGHTLVFPHAPSFLREAYDINYIVVDLRYRKYFESFWGEEIELLDNPIFKDENYAIVAL